MKRAAIGILLYVGCAIAGYLWAAPRSDVEIKAEPQIVRAGQLVTLNIHIRPAESDRWLAIETDGNSSVMQLDGWNAPRWYRRRWAMDEPGEYRITAAVGNGDRIRAQNSTTVLVVE